MKALYLMMIMILVMGLSSCDPSECITPCCANHPCPSPSNDPNHPGRMPSYHGPQPGGGGVY